MRQRLRWSGEAYCIRRQGKFAMLSPKSSLCSTVSNKDTPSLAKFIALHVASPLWRGREAQLDFAPEFARYNVTVIFSNHTSMELPLSYDDFVRCCDSTGGMGMSFTSTVIRGWQKEWGGPSPWIMVGVFYVP